MKTALVLGAGGFIGTHLVRRLKKEGYWVRGVDLKYPEFSKSESDEFLLYNLTHPRNVEAVMRIDYTHEGSTPLEFKYNKPAYSKQIPFDEVYQLAADMGGAGYVFTGEHDADIMSNSALINLNVAAWAQIYGVKKLFYSSSACIYPQQLQSRDDSFYGGWYRDENNNLIDTYGGLKESDAYPANPDSEYGWEKLFSERLYLSYARNYGLNVRIARFHNIYGPEGTYKGGKEKAPAAMCRKFIEAINSEKREMEIWGDGNQTRSFLYVDDCIDAVRLLMESDFKEPINIGSEEMVSINDLAKMVIDGVNVSIKHISGPTGVRGRNSNNDLIRKVLGWEPKYKLEEGIRKTFEWIKSQMQ